MLIQFRYNLFKIELELVSGMVKVKSRKKNVNVPSFYFTQFSK